MRISTLSLLISLGLTISATANAQMTTKLSDKPISETSTKKNKAVTNAETKSTKKTTVNTGKASAHKKASSHDKKILKATKTHHTKSKKASNVALTQEEVAYQHLEKFEAAIARKDWEKVEHYKQLVLKIAPKYPELYNGLGYPLIDRSTHVEEGLKLVEKTLAVSPNDQNSLDSKAWAYSKLGRNQEAADILASILDKFTPGEYNYAEVYAHYAFVLYKLGRFQEAEKAWKVAQSDQPEHDVVLRIGQELGFLTNNAAQNAPKAIVEENAADKNTTNTAPAPEAIEPKTPMK